MGSRALLVIALLCLCVPAFGTTRASSATACLRPKAVLASGLGRGLRPTAHVTLKKVAAVRGRGRFRNVVASGVYFVSANLGKQRIATWAVSPRAYSTGHGAIFAVDRNARRVSVFGSLISPQLLSSWGVNARTTGYSASRICVRMSS